MNDRDLVEVFRTPDPMLLAIVKTALEAAGIEHSVQGEQALGMFPLGPAAMGLTKNLVAARLFVTAEDEAEARDVLAGVDVEE